MQGSFNINMIRRHAGNATLKNPIIPSPELGVDFAQNRARINHLKTAQPPKSMAKVPSIKTLDDKMFLAQGQNVDVSQFPKLGYIGEGEY